MRLDRPTDWAAVWRAARVGKIDTALGKWLQSLPAAPAVRIILGSGGIHLRTAKSIAALLAGWWPGAVGEWERIGKRRPTGRVEPDGTLREWRSRRHAAADLGLTRWAVTKAVHTGAMIELG
jgi:hypothetical protein